MSELSFSQASLNFDGSSLQLQADMPLITDICSTAVVSRLKDVSFLGAIDYAIRPPHDGDFLTTRFDHSVGVAVLAMRAAQHLGLSTHEVKLAAAAGLLHDLGHGPLSHSLEPKFAERFGINHHRTTEHLISGEDPKGQSLRRVLLDHSVSPTDVIRVLDGTLASRVTHLFAHSINVDTIEGIHRSAAYLRGYELTHSPMLVVEAFTNALTSPPSVDKVAILDSFWAMKHQVYYSLIRSSLGVLSDMECQKYFDQNEERFRASDFFLTDRQLDDRFKGLLTRLRTMRWKSRRAELPDWVDYQARSFFVAHEHTLDGTFESFKARYRQTKHERRLHVAKKESHIKEETLELQEDSGGQKDF